MLSMNSFEELIPFIFLEQLFKAVYDKHWTLEFIYFFTIGNLPHTHTHKVDNSGVKPGNYISSF